MRTMNFIKFIKKAIEAYKKMFLPLTNANNISHMALEILLQLSDNPNQNTSKEICQCLCVKPSIVSFHVENLVKDGYIERVNIDGDRRKHGLVLTEKAVPVVEDAEKFREKYVNVLNSGLNEDDLAHIHRIFMTMEKNIDSFDKGGNMLDGE